MKGHGIDYESSLDYERDFPVSVDEMTSKGLEWELLVM